MRWRIASGGMTQGDTSRYTPPMIPLSILDVTAVPEGSTTADALQNARDLAQHAERWGYHRLWVAEHHNMQSIASAATSIVIAHLANATTSIRLGSGGIMLPNHAPLVIAEQFGTLATLFPGRIDLGLGRAPGTDPRTAQALRRNMNSSVDSFPNDVLELQYYLKPAQPGQAVVATPGAGTEVPLWILGSSLYGAELAAMLGPAFCVCLALCPRLYGTGDSALPEKVRTLGTAGQTLRDAGLQRVCGGYQ